MYNKLFTKILDSSIWLEPNSTRIVWITLIAAMDEDGFAQFSSVRNLANRAMVTADEAEAAVKTLEAPDPDSNNKAHEGRRIERVPGGWMVLNAAEHREMVTRAIKREQTRERVAKHRAKNNKEKVVSNARVTPSEAVSVSEAQSETEEACAGLNLEVWQQWVEYRRSIGKALKPASIRPAQRKLARFGDQQPAVVEQSIANGWLGLFETKDGGNGKGRPTRYEELMSRVGKGMPAEKSDAQKFLEGAKL